jgi:hypothetical protein
MDHAMNLPTRYTLACFTEYTRDYIPYGFETIADHQHMPLFKRYMDEDRNVRQEWMVYVGRYWTQDGKQLVCARPTGLGIQYYYGHHSALELEIVEDNFKARIYFKKPFIYISGAQDGNWNNARKYGVVATETVINFLGLRNGWIVHVDHEKNVDMLAALYHACVNFEPRKEEAEEKELEKRQNFDDNEAAQAGAWGRRNDAWTHRGNHWPAGGSPFSSTSPSYPKDSSSPKVKDEPMDDDDDDRVFNRKFRFPQTPVRSTPRPGISLIPTRGSPTRSSPYHRKYYDSQNI